MAKDIILPPPSYVRALANQGRYNEYILHQQKDIELYIDHTNLTLVAWNPNRYLFLFETGV